MKRKRKNYEQAEGNRFMQIGFGPSPADIPIDAWYTADKLLRVEQGTDTLRLCFAAGPMEPELSVTAPSTGGIRFCTEEKGYFEPDAVGNLIFSQEAGERVVQFQTEDGTGFSLDIEENGGWKIEIADSEATVQRTFSSSSFAFGYAGGVLQKVRLTLPIAEDEMLFGLGERFSGLDQVGERQFFWNTDCCYHGRSEHYELWRAYKNIPLLHSSQGNSLFFNSFYPAVSDVGYTDAAWCVWEFWGPVFDFYVWTGTLAQRIERYTDLTGKPFLPPKWAFRYMSGGGNGFWYGEDWGNGNIPEKYLAVLQTVLERYEELGTPHVAALYGEGWIADNPAAYAMLRPYGTRMLRWNPPDYPKEVMQEALPGLPDKDLPRIKDVRDPSRDAGNYIDFFNPYVKDMLKNRYARFFEMGLRGGMLDFAEMVPDYALYSNGMTGREMHNFNPYWYTKVYSEAARELVGEDYLYYCRGGCAGSQRWSAVFSGDQAAAFYGLRQQLNGALSIGTCGFSAWGGDLAGYEGKPTPEVFIRGMQFAAFQPLMRAHGTRTRCPWDFGKEAEAVYLRCYWLRENLLDKLYSSAVQASRTGLPMMQAMPLAFPAETNFRNETQQYLFCDDFLVAPVLEEGARDKEICFPSGAWYDMWQGSRVFGPAQRRTPVTLYDCPVYLRAGAVFPVALNQGLRFAEKFEEDEGVPALLLTPPQEERTVSFYKSRDEVWEYTISGDEESFCLCSALAMDIQNLIVYADVREIQVDGKAVEYERLPAIGDSITRLRLPAIQWRRLDLRCRTITD